MAIKGFSILSGWGSKPSDIQSIDSVKNPLPPCPNSPNCIRITQRINLPIDATFSIIQDAIKQMNPAKTEALENQYQIKAVFSVFFFKDDVTVQLTKENPNSSFLHIRSASRVGFSDLGVNRRRVKKLLKQIKSQR